MMRAQISIEYMIVFIFMLLLLLPSVTFFTQEFGVTTDRLKENQLNSFANTFITTAEKVYFMGAPASRLFFSRLPEDVVSFQLENNPQGLDELVLKTRNTFGEENVVALTTDAHILFLSAPSDTMTGLRTVFVEAYDEIDGINKRPLAVISLNGRCPTSVFFDLDESNTITCDDVALFNKACLSASRPSPGTWPANDWFNKVNKDKSCYHFDYSGDCTITEDDINLLTVQTPNGFCTDSS